MSTEPARTTRKLTRSQLLQRVSTLPPGDQGEALGLLELIYGQKARATDVDSQVAQRDIEKRRSYAGMPERYFRDILAIKIITSQQEDVLRDCDKYDRLLIPSGNGTGKSFLLAGFGCYRYDAVAALPDPLGDFAEQGARILLPAPTEKSVEATAYHEMQKHAERAAANGYPMPGRRLLKPSWWVRHGWDVSMIVPRRQVGQKIAHSASGRHHANMIALVEEAAGVFEAVWLAIEGMCSGQGNKILCAFQPADPTGPAAQRARLSEWRVLHLSAFDHPNVRGRQIVVPGAVGHTFVDTSVRVHCQDIGAWPERKPDPLYNEFVYALPRPGTPERSMVLGVTSVLTPLQTKLLYVAREDGIPGHPDAEPRIYRPDSIAEAQVLGRWPSSSQRGLFSEGQVRAAFLRWAGEPPSAPDRVGLDCAREGDDDSGAMPAWGRGAEWLLRAWQEAVKDGADPVLDWLHAKHAVVGRFKILPKGTGPRVADAAVAEFPLSPFIVDAGGVGSSVYDHLVEVIRADASAVQFGAMPPEPVLGEPWSENMRTAMYVRASMLVRFGLVDVAEDPLLLEELLAHELLSKQRTVEVDGRKERVEAVLLIAKDKIKERIGRSPDRADAFVLALTEPSTIPGLPRFTFGA